MKNCGIIALWAIVLLCSCKKVSTENIHSGDTGSLELEFDNIVGPDDLQLNTSAYTNSSGESFTISALKYFVSNILLKKSDGSEYIVPADSSYFLVNEQETSSHVVELNNIPAGDYTSFTFTIGIDSLKNVAPVYERTGVLDPEGSANGMYWNSNSGYIFLKMEGESPASTRDDHKFSYHIGGFGNTSPPINNIRIVTLTAPAGMMAMVRKDKTTPPEVHIFADAGKILDGQTTVSIAAFNTIELSPVSLQISNNYSEMFSIDHIHND